MNYKKSYEYWLNNEYFDESTRQELRDIAQDEKEIEDRFYRELEFGTAGLRGKIAAGTNRMNIYVISKATQGLADYIVEHGEAAMKRGVAIAFDCRHFSKEFAERAALVLAANGIKAYLFDSLRPTPELSYAVRRLGTISGIVVTASHNPREYNGYKVYWEDGAQILSHIANGILEKISRVEDYGSIKLMNRNEAVEKGLLQIIGKEIDDEYIEKVKGLSLSDDIDKNIKVVYTPLNGTGNIPVRRVLSERGFTNIMVVPEQESPDPDFTTVGYPNPEDTKAFKYAESFGREVDAELLLATDPDCDRLAIMVRNSDGVYEAFNGNQTGAVLIQYILQAMSENNMLPEKGVIVKSIVTGDLGRAIAKKYRIATEEVLTGFKNICGKVNEYEERGSYQFIFGYEESIGYVTGTFVRDKDGVSSAMLLCEAAAYYKKRGRTLIDVLNDIYKEFGFYRENLISVVLEGIEGQERIGRMMKRYREEYPHTIGKSKLVKYIDFDERAIYNLVTGSKEPCEIPKSDVLKFYFDDESWYAVRPSGTEPKIKIYMYSKGSNDQEAKNKLKGMEEVIMGKLYSVE